MSRSSNRLPLAALAVVVLATGRAHAADLWAADAGSLLRTETISAEVSAGYLTGMSKEYVYDVSRVGSPKLSQLNWDLGNSFAVGGRVAWRPLDWLTFRGRGWATVASDSNMTDYDWLYGYAGMNSWSHKSESPNTDVAKAWQADASVAATYYEADDLALTAIAGYRHYTAKFNATGGSYIYSSNGFRDTSGMLPSDRLGIGYQQWWDTPYLGLGASYSDGSWTVSSEVIGSPFVMARDQDHHALRDLVFKENFSMSSMVGATLGAEYTFAPGLSLAGRLEYQKYFKTTGDTLVVDGLGGGAQRVPSPSSGGEADTLLLSLGVKARI